MVGQRWKIISASWRYSLQIISPMRARSTWSENHLRSSNSGSCLSSSIPLCFLLRENFSSFFASGHLYPPFLVDFAFERVAQATVTSDRLWKKWEKKCREKSGKLEETRLGKERQREKIEGNESERTSCPAEGRRTIVSPSGPQKSVVELEGCLSLIKISHNPFHVLWQSSLFSSGRRFNPLSHSATYRFVKQNS